MNTVVNAREKLEDCCSAIQVDFHVTWTPVIAGLQFDYNKPTKFMLANTNWNPSYNISGCVQMCHNYSASAIELKKENTHMPVARKDWVAQMLPIEKPTRGYEENCVPLRALTDKPSDEKRKLLPLTPVDCDEDWGEVYIRDMKEILLLDLAKPDNMDTVAEHYNIGEAWNSIKSDFETNEFEGKYTEDMLGNGGSLLMSHQLRRFYTLLHQNVSNKRWMASTIEGKHGFVGVSSLLIGQYFDKMNSDASIKTELTYKTLQAHDLVDSAAIDKMKGTFLQEIDAMLRGERDKTDMFANPCSIKLYYLKAPIEKDGSVTAEDVMAYCRGVSEAISDSKLDSNRAFAIDTIADYANSMGCAEINKTKINNRPDYITDGNTWPTIPLGAYRKPASLVKNKIDPATKERMAELYEFPDWYNSKEQKDLIEDPASVNADVNWKVFWKRPAVNKKKRTMVPPLVNTLNSLLVDPGEKKKHAITTSNINQMYFAIKTMLCLYAGLKKITVKEAIKDPKRIELTEVMIYFYTTANFSVDFNQLPMGIKMWYPDCFPGNRVFDSAEKGIMMSCKLFTTMIDVAWIHPGEFNAAPNTNARENYEFESVEAVDKMRQRFEAVSYGLTLIGKQCTNMENLIYNTSE